MLSRDLTSPGVRHAVNQLPLPDLHVFALVLFLYRDRVIARSLYWVVEPTGIKTVSSSQETYRSSIFGGKCKFNIGP